MDYVFEKDLPILPSMCDAYGRLSYPCAFACFMDAAAQHGEFLGVGWRDMSARNLFWLTVKTKIMFVRRPHMGEHTTLITWPEVPGRIRCIRSYEIRQNDDLLLCGKTEWAVLNTETKRIVPASEAFPNGNLFRQESACNEAFTKIPDEFDCIEPYAAYNVRSTDIDVGGHMNNAAYLRTMFGTFSNEELKTMKIRSVDAIFRSPCLEGDELLWQRKQTPAGLRICAKAGHQTVFLSSIK